MDLDRPRSAVESRASGASHLVSLFVDFLASGMTVEEILAEFPQLTVEDIRACLADE